MPALKQYCTGTQSAIEINNAKTRDRGYACIFDGVVACPTGQLPDCFHQSQETAGRACLANRKLATLGVMRERAVIRQRIRLDEFACSAFLAEA